MEYDGGSEGAWLKRMDEHLLVLSAKRHVEHQAWIESRSSCSRLVSLKEVMDLRNFVSSANIKVEEDVMDSGMSLI